MRLFDLLDSPPGEAPAHAYYDEPHVVYEVAEAGRGVRLARVRTCPSLAAAADVASDLASEARLFKRRRWYWVRHCERVPSRIDIARRLRARGLIG